MTTPRIIVDLIRFVVDIIDGDVRFRLLCVKMISGDFINYDLVLKYETTAQCCQAQLFCRAYRTTE